MMRKADLQRALTRITGGALKRIVVSVDGSLYDITTVQSDFGLVVIHVETPALIEDQKSDVAG